MYDVIVIGAGPGGSATAHYLARHGLDVLLLDKFDFPRDKTCGDALTPRALEVLADMGLLEAMGQVGCEVNKVKIFAPGGGSTVAAMPHYNGRPGYAMIVPRLSLDNAIRERAVDSGAKFEGRIQVTNIEPTEAGVRVSGGRRGRSVTHPARLAVIATGASPQLLLQTGILPEAPPMMMAARAYFENINYLTDEMQFYFEGVPLPGYGWVFPLPDSTANIGAGFFRRGRTARHMPATPAAAFETFINHPPLQTMLAGARRVGPVKGYPLRIDFATAPTVGERILVVGEAAGLVNPLTGEGIDYALESGRIAARHLIDLFGDGDLSRPKLAVYDQLLRRQFQSLFRFCYRMQGFLPYRSLLNRLVKAADHQNDLKTLLVNIVLGNYDISGGIPRQAILKGLFSLAAAGFL
jgi:geranylgeranyl reductase family protein